jgi:uncharacterized Zn finger protein
MPIRPCPNCGAQTARFLESSSVDAYVWYYRCASCGHVWTVLKADGVTIRHVTPLPDPLETTEK